MSLRRTKPRVLLVDDDVAVRRLLSRFFVDLGLHVLEADNPFTALGRMTDGPFDLVVTDIDMPERSGVWLIEELRGRAPDLPLIVMTAGELQKAGLRALYGCEVRVVRKPFELNELENLIREIAPHLISENGVVASFTPPEPQPADSRPYAYASKLVGEMLARTVGLENTSLPWKGRVHPDDQQRIEEEAHIAVRSGRRFRAEYRLLGVDGDTTWVLHEAPVRTDAAGQPTLTAGAILDITARKLEEELLRASEERHRFLTEHSTDVITVQSPEALFLYASPACQSLLGYDANELIGMSAFELVHQDDLAKVRESHEAAITRPYMGTIDYRIRRKDRRYIWFESTSQVIARSNPALPREIISVSRDITERKETEDRLRALAILDDLTGLYNRRGFLTIATQQLKAARRAQRNALVLFADLNNLKQINDTLGHKDGDQALIDAAHIFNRTFRESDVIARVGGDEFAILAVESEPAHLETIRARIESALQLANSDRARAFELSISIGAAAYDPARNDSVEELLAWADRAMYAQKRSHGGERVH